MHPKRADEIIRDRFGEEKIAKVTPWIFLKVYDLIVAAEEDQIEYIRGVLDLAVAIEK